MYYALPINVFHRKANYGILRAKHVHQMGNEIVGLHQVCKKYNVLDDVFRLLRDKYVFRPVKKEKRQIENENATIDCSPIIGNFIFVLLSVIFCF